MRIVFPYLDSIEDNNLKSQLRENSLEYLLNKDLIKRYNNAHHRMIEQLYNRIKSNGSKYLDSRTDKLFYKKKNQYRPIVEREIINIDNNNKCEIFFIIEIFNRNDNDYPVNKRMIEEWYKKNNKITEYKKDIKKFINIIQNEQTIESKTIPDFYYLLNNGNVVEKEILFETETWVKRVNTLINETYAAPFGEEILSLHDDKDLSEKVKIKEIQLNQKYYIYYTVNRLSIPVKDSYEEVDYIILHSIEKNNEEKITPIKNDIDELSKNTVKAYPMELLIDIKNWWNDIEQNTIPDNPGTLSLSAEEFKILNSKITPLYISGRAGTGKSTILYYLYAYYYKTIKKLNSNVAPPIFFTYTKNLKKYARENVTKILKSMQIDIERDIEDSFYTLNEFIKENILKDKPDILIKYKEDDYINYFKFEKLFDKKFRNSKISPEIMWYVIRSFIKGYNYDRYVVSSSDQLPNEETILYQDLSKDVREIDENTFDEIFKLYISWYRDLKNEWDDIDLVREALKIIKEEENIKKYPVIFCDEAQDFTSIELELLMYIFDLTDYDLYNNHGNIPIPFFIGGDPIQTINPSGFNEGVLTAKFHDIINKFSNPNRRIKLNTEILENNYRSAKPIVYFSNKILEYKKETGYKGKIERQESYKIDNVGGVYFLDKQSFKKALETRKHALSGYKVIIPDKEYDLNDEEIKEDFFYTPLDIKGLEDDKVFMLDFAEQEWFKLLKQDKKQLDDPSLLLIQYQISKLYVSATRARNELIIVDDDKTIWEKYFRGDYIQYDVFDLDTLEGKSEKEIEKNANELFTKGVLQADKRSLNKAKYLYDNIRKTKESKKAEIEIMIIDAEDEKSEEKWKKAGELIKDNEFQKEEKEYFYKAIECFWKCKDFKSIVEISDSVNHEKNIYIYIAKFLTTKEEQEVLINLFKNLNKWPRIDKVDDILLEQLNYILDETKNKYLSKLFDEQLLIIKDSLNQLSEKLLKKEKGKINDIIAFIHYYLKEYDAAVKKWESLFKKDIIKYPKEYHEIIIKGNYPVEKKIVSYDQLEQYKEITYIYEKNKDEIKKENKNIFELIAKSYEKNSVFLKALDVRIEYSLLEYFPFNIIGEDVKQEKISQVFNLIIRNNKDFKEEINKTFDKLLETRDNNIIEQYSIALFKTTLENFPNQIYLIEYILSKLNEYYKNDIPEIIKLKLCEFLSLKKYIQIVYSYKYIRNIIRDILYKYKKHYDEYKQKIKQEYIFILLNIFYKNEDFDSEEFADIFREYINLIVDKESVKIETPQKYKNKIRTLIYSLAKSGFSDLMVLYDYLLFNKLKTNNRDYEYNKNIVKENVLYIIINAIIYNTDDNKILNNKSYTNTIDLLKDYINNEEEFNWMRKVRLAEKIYSSTALLNFYNKWENIFESQKYHNDKKIQKYLDICRKRWIYHLYEKGGISEEEKEEFNEKKKKLNINDSDIDKIIKFKLEDDIIKFRYTKSRIGIEWIDYNYNLRFEFYQTANKLRITNIDNLEEITIEYDNLFGPFEFNGKNFKFERFYINGEIKYTIDEQIYIIYEKQFPKHNRTDIKHYSD